MRSVIDALRVEKNRFVFIISVPFAKVAFYTGFPVKKRFLEKIWAGTDTITYCITSVPFAKFAFYTGFPVKKRVFEKMWPGPIINYLLFIISLGLPSVSYDEDVVEEDDVQLKDICLN